MIIILDESPCAWHQCADNLLCIPDTAVCNDRADCLDGSDEMNCKPDSCCFTVSQTVTIVSDYCDISLSPITQCCNMS